MLYFFSAFEQNYQEGLTGGAAGLAGVSGPPSVTKEVPATLPERNFTAQHESRLLEYLLTNYNRHVRPVLNHTKNVTVNVGITLTQIFDMVSNFGIFFKFDNLKIYVKLVMNLNMKLILYNECFDKICGQMIKESESTIQKVKTLR